MCNRDLISIPFGPNDAEAHLQIISLVTSYSIGFNDHASIKNIFLKLCKIFGHNDNITRQITIDIVQKVSTDLKEKVFLFVQQHAEQFPQFHKLRQLFEKIENGDYIFIIQSKKKINFTTEEFNNICMMLEYSKKGTQFEELQASYNYFFGNTFKHYSIYFGNGDRAQYIGESDKNKRVCRYCGQSAPDVTFKKKGHTISEALGNKTLITYDECDHCNSKFGAGIEESIIEYFNFYRTFFAIKGKEGVPCLKGENYTIRVTNDGKIDFQFSLPDEYAHLYQEGLDKNHPPTRIPLVSRKKIVEQDIYRCISKYAIGILPSEKLTPFKKTIQWINKEFDATELPNIAVLTTYSFFNHHPSILVYTLNDNDSNLPFAVCEFHFACFVFVAIIPTFDGQSFCKKDEFNTFWTNFYYSKTPNWSFANFTSNTPKKLMLLAKFEQNKNGAR